MGLFHGLVWTSGDILNWVKLGEILTLGGYSNLDSHRGGILQLLQSPWTFATECHLWTCCLHLHSIIKYLNFNHPNVRSSGGSPMSMVDREQHFCGPGQKHISPENHKKHTAHGGPEGLCGLLQCTLLVTAPGKPICPNLLITLNRFHLPRWIQGNHLAA